MMSQSVDEDDAVLKDLVSRTLQSNGALGKIQAQLRASVFLALEEEFKDRDVPLCNQRTQKLLASPAGSLAASLVHDFFMCLGLDFSLSVYGPESNLGAGLWTLVNRDSLLKWLGLGQDDDPTIPVLLTHCSRQHQQQQQTTTTAPQSLLTAATEQNVQQGRELGATAAGSRGSARQRQDSLELPATTKTSATPAATTNVQTVSATSSSTPSSTTAAKSSSTNTTAANSSSTITTAASRSSNIASVSNSTSKTAAGSNSTTRNSASSSSTTSTAAGSISTSKTAASSNPTTKTAVSSSSTTAAGSNPTTETATSSSSITASGSNSSTKNADGSSSTTNNKTSDPAGNNNNIRSGPSSSSSQQATGDTVAAKSTTTSSNKSSSGSRRLGPPSLPLANILSAAPPDCDGDSSSSSSLASPLTGDTKTGLRLPQDKTSRRRQRAPGAGMEHDKNELGGEEEEEEYTDDFSVGSSSSHGTSATSTDYTSTQQRRDNLQRQRDARQAPTDCVDENAAAPPDREGGSGQGELNEESERMMTEEDISLEDLLTTDSSSGLEDTEDLTASKANAASIDYQENL